MPSERKVIALQSQGVATELAPQVGFTKGFPYNLLDYTRRAGGPVGAIVWRCPQNVSSRKMSRITDFKSEYF